MIVTTVFLGSGVGYLWGKESVGRDEDGPLIVGLGILGLAVHFVFLLMIRSGVDFMTKHKSAAISLEETLEAAGGTKLIGTDETSRTVHLLRCFLWSS